MANTDFICDTEDPDLVMCAYWLGRLKRQYPKLTKDDLVEKYMPDMRDKLKARECKEANNAT